MFEGNEKKKSKNLYLISSPVSYFIYVIYNMVKIQKMKPQHPYGKDMIFNAIVIQLGTYILYDANNVKISITADLKGI